MKYYVLVYLLLTLLQLTHDAAIAEPVAPSNARKEALPLVLKNMPMNSELRCVGIAAVAEGLLEGKLTEASRSPITIEQLSQAIFASLSTDAPVAYPAELTIDGKKLPITDTAALNQLGSRVTELYKAEAKAKWIAEQPAGIDKLQNAQGLAVQSEKELRQALAKDEDKTEVFCCFGFREFPNGTYRETHHAVVLRELQNGTLAVFDSNDPGKMLACHFSTLHGNFMVEWRCGYRDRGFSTTQIYQVVPKSRFFRTVR